VCCSPCLSCIRSCIAQQLLCDTHTHTHTHAHTHTHTHTHTQTHTHTHSHTQFLFHGSHILLGKRYEANALVTAESLADFLSLISCHQFLVTDFLSPKSCHRFLVTAESLADLTSGPPPGMGSTLLQIVQKEGVKELLSLAGACVCVMLSRLYRTALGCFANN